MHTDKARVSLQPAPLPYAMAPRHLHDAEIAALADYVDAHLQFQISISELAQLLEMERREFVCACQTEFGISPDRYILTRRVARAKALLSASKASVDAIVTEAGFASKFHLFAVLTHYQPQTKAAQDKHGDLTSN